MRQLSGVLPGVAFIVDSFAGGIRNADPKCSHLAAMSITSDSTSNRQSESTFKEHICKNCHYRYRHLVYLAECHPLEKGHSLKGLKNVIVLEYVRDGVETYFVAYVCRFALTHTFQGA